MLREDDNFNEDFQMPLVYLGRMLVGEQDRPHPKAVEPIYSLLCAILGLPGTPEYDP